MESFIVILAGIAIAALIGGVTNYLAIRMLFHPRSAWHIFGRKVPFTPGLIPKRKDEIAESLGRVVSEYLVTSHGLNEVMRTPEFAHGVESKLQAIWHDWANDTQTLRQFLQRYWTEEQLRRGIGTSAQIAREWVERGVSWLWKDRGWGQLQLGQVLPNWSDSFRRELAERAARFVLEQAAAEILTGKADFLLRRLIARFVGQSGGLFGTLAGIFMDEHKIAKQAKEALLAQLQSSSVHTAVAEFIYGKFEAAEQMTLEQVVEKLAGRDGEQWLAEQVKNGLKWEQWLERLGEQRICDLLPGKDQWAATHIRSAVQFALQRIEQNMDRMIAYLRLPEMVENQVRKFPVERLEEIILSVSGKEFRAITWLGALLGGLIGIVQVVLLRL